MCLQKNRPQKVKLSKALYLLVIAEGFEPRPLTLNFIGFRLAYVL